MFQLGELVVYGSTGVCRVEGFAGLDQPGEPIVWDGKLIVSCFDLVTGPDKVNMKHEMPATLVYMDL